jgi:hypothetical protein
MSFEAPFLSFPCVIREDDGWHVYPDMCDAIPADNLADALRIVGMVMAPDSQVRECEACGRAFVAVKRFGYVATVC